MGSGALCTVLNRFSGQWAVSYLWFLGASSLPVRAVGPGLEPKGGSAVWHCGAGFEEC